MFFYPKIPNLKKGNQMDNKDIHIFAIDIQGEVTTVLSTPIYI